MMQQTSLAGLVRIALPDRSPVLLCDGGFIDFSGERYRSSDATFGTIASIEGLDEGQGDEIPALDIDLFPAETAAAGDLSKPGYQQSRVQMWIAEYDVATGQIVGTPDPMFDGQIDQTSLRLGKGRTLSMSVVSNAERLFEFDIGNSWSPTFHKSVWPGEKGHDNASGLKISVAWGVAGPSAAIGGGNARAGMVDAGRTPFGRYGRESY